jgi:ATP-dependent Clp protease adaptor protein ClpS
MSETSIPTPPAPDTETEVERDIEFIYDENAELDPPYDVIIHNDDVTPMDFVVLVLFHLFKLALRDAERVMWQAHTRGQAYVATLSFEEAKYRVLQAHRAARAQSYPLTFTIERQ